MKVLMVCLGNICRSPLADGLLRRKVEEQNLPFIVDSAGTSGFHEGEKADARMIETAKNFGTDLSFLRSRPITKSDLDEFDVIYVMDRNNYRDVIGICSTDEQREKVIPILDLVYPEENRIVPDPYYGGTQGFIDVYEMLDEATDKIISNFKMNGKR
ncbi:MAG: low molecular weight phosphotyrosine protein phosphatase [Flavobacteriia bacterium]|nr:low molecular weight phosphotyrosine protein phosphatase [Flavobacteriia bacterium]OJX39690.1 MAG: protein-tyrosine-phosphatase [Flavobacteriia bacterium 40-80]